MVHPYLPSTAVERLGTGCRCSTVIYKHSNQGIQATLWEGIATLPSGFNRAEVEASTEPIIVAMTALKVKDYLRKAKDSPSMVQSIHVATNKDLYYTACLKCGQSIFKAVLWMPIQTASFKHHFQ
ncbi:hypothetical protein Hanom_Chr16g01471211 [Helianthus anomalus]